MVPEETDDAIDGEEGVAGDVSDMRGSTGRFEGELKISSSGE